MTIFLILAAILLLGILIVVHELGHFWAARATGIAVHQFSVGFGPKLITWKSKKYDTEFMIRAIPLGGYCMFVGEDDAQGNHDDDPKAYNKQKVWKRMLSVVMGPAMNFVLAFVAAVLLFGIGGIQSVWPYVNGVEEGSPAAQAGFEQGDILSAVNGQSVLDGTTSTVVGLIGAYQKGDEPLLVEVLRGAEKTPVQLSVTPFFDEASQRYRVGIGVDSMLAPDKIRLSFGETISYSYNVCLNAGKLILGGLRDLLSTGKGLNESAGPVGIVSEITQQTRQYGLEGYMYLMIILSINLGLVNLLPIPGLDGSRFLFMVVEGIFRRPINRKAEAIIHLSGFVLLLSAMLFFTFKDIQRLIQ